MNEYRRLLTLFDSIESESQSLTENAGMPGWLTGSLFIRRIQDIASATGWRQARPGTKLYSILLEAVRLKVSQDRAHEGKSSILKDNELMFFFPRKMRLRELQEPVVDLSTARDILNKYTLQTKTSVQKQEEPSQDSWYILIDLVGTKFYRFFIRKDSTGNWVAPGSPGFQSLYYNPNIGVATFKQVLSNLEYRFSSAPKFL